MQFSLGIFLFTLCLYYYALIFLAHKGEVYLESKNPNNLSFLSKILISLQNPKVRTISGFIAFLIALWNFFAPDFGSVRGGITIIGALIPSLLLLFDSFILNPQLIEMFPLSFSIKEKLTLTTDKLAPIAGWLTLAIAIIHTFFAFVPFL